MRLSSENRLLVALAREAAAEPPADGRGAVAAPGPTADPAALAALAEPEALLAAARDHGAVTLLARAIERGRLTAVAARMPRAALERLRRSADGIALHGMLLAEALGEVLSALRARGIVPVVLKGLLLEALFWPEDLPRPTGDLDLLVAEKDLAGALECLRALGYAADSPAAEAVSAADAIREGAIHLPPRRKGAATVELHRALLAAAPSRAASGDDLFEPSALLARSVPVRLPRIGEARTLASGDLVLYVAAHAAHHSFEGGLRDLLDIARVVAFPLAPVAWGEIAARAGGSAHGAGVLDALALARGYLGAPVPAEALAALRGPLPPRARWVSGRIRRGFFRLPRAGLRAALERFLERSDWTGDLARFLTPSPVELAAVRGVGAGTRGSRLARLAHPLWTLARLAGLARAPWEGGKRRR